MIVMGPNFGGWGYQDPLKLPQTNMETHMAPFKGTVVFIGPFLGFHVSLQKGIIFGFAFRV